MSRTRRRLVLAATVALLFFAVAAWLSWSDSFAPPQIRAFSHLRLGMTLAEVEAILGEPKESNENKGSTLLWRHFETVRATGLPEEALPNSLGGYASDPYPEKLTVEIWYWREEGFMIETAFNAEGKAVGFYLLESLSHRQPSLLDRLQGLFK